MKFGKYLSSVVDTANPEWVLFFLNYKALKQILKKSTLRNRQMIEDVMNVSGIHNERGGIKEVGSSDSRREEEMLQRDNDVISHNRRVTNSNWPQPKESESNTEQERMVRSPLQAVEFFRCKQ